MPRRNAVQRDAERLAEFIRLPDQHRADIFAKKNPRFAPKGWWTYRPTYFLNQPTNEMQWKIVQRLVRQAWEEQFELSLVELTKLLLAVFDPQDLVRRTFDVVQQNLDLDETAQAMMLGEPYCPAFAEIAEVADDYGFHLGIRYLAEHTWAARFCKRGAECAFSFEGKGCPYAADHSKRTHCSTTCSGAVIRATHNKWWHKVGSKRRRAKRRRSKQG